MHLSLQGGWFVCVVEQLPVFRLSLQRRRGEEGEEGEWRGRERRGRG